MEGGEISTMNKQTLKWIKELSREEFKGRKLGSRIINKKPKQTKHLDYDDELDIDDEEFFFWKNPRKLSR